VRPQVRVELVEAARLQQVKQTEFMKAVTRPSSSAILYFGLNKKLEMPVFVG
jgi:hypothetical protein